MRMTNHFLYKHDTDCKMIALPYVVTQSDKNISMIILKPKRHKPLHEISALEQLDNFLEDFDQIDSKMVDLKMPKFKFG